MQRALEWITRRPGWALAAVALLTVLACDRIVDLRTGEPRLLIDASVDSMLPEDDEERAYYEHVQLLFGSDETLVLAFLAEDVFAPARLRAIQRITQKLEGLPDVDRVLSLANAPNFRSAEGDVVVEPFLADVPEAPAAIERLRREALANPFYGGTLVSESGRAGALIVHLRDRPESELIERGVDREILELARSEAGDATVWLAGGLYVKAETSRLLLRDLARTVPLAVLVTFVVALVTLRTFGGVLVPLLTVAIALVWTLGFVSAVGSSLNLVTALIPTLIIVVGFAYALHVVSEYYHVLREGIASEEPVLHAAREVALPVVLTGVTTAAGFLALATSRIGAIREFAFFSTAGVAATVLASLTFAPAALKLLPPPRRLARGQGPDGFDRLATRVAGFNLRHRRLVLTAGAVVAAVALFGMTRIEISNDFVRDFDEASPVRRGIDAVDEHLGGSNAFHMVLRADEPGAFKEPARLREIEALQRWLESQPEVGATTSVVDYVKLLNRGFHGDDPEQLRVPDSRRMVATLLFFGSADELERYADSRYQTAAILVRSKVSDSGAMAALLDRIALRTGGLPEGLTARVTGNSVLVARTIDDLARGQSTSLGIAFAVILAILTLLFTSVRIGVVAMIPNALPVVVYFGLLGWTGVTLNTTTGLVACLVLGIAIDDTIHFLARFNAAARERMDESEGVVEALRTVGRPVTYTSIALCLGFLVLTTSELRNQVEFGILAAATLAFAWLVDVTFTPALAARMKIVTLWDAVTLDLGREPQHSIPLFEGLRTFQARIVALMMQIEEHPKGELLIRVGEEGDDMYVVLDGTLAVEVETPRGTEQLDTRSRGDVVGEVALFHGRRTADVRALTDVRLLRLDRRSLERLRSRYPRTGAAVYRNLARILADRVAMTTERLR